MGEGGAAGSVGEMEGKAGGVWARGALGSGLRTPDEGIATEMGSATGGGDLPTTATKGCRPVGEVEGEEGEVSAMVPPPSVAAPAVGIELNLVSGSVEDGAQE